MQVVSAADADALHYVALRCVALHSFLASLPWLGCAVFVFVLVLFFLFSWFAGLLVCPYVLPWLHLVGFGGTYLTWGWWGGRTRPMRRDRIFGCFSLCVIESLQTWRVQSLCFCVVWWVG